MVSVRGTYEKFLMCTISGAEVAVGAGDAEGEAEGDGDAPWAPKRATASATQARGAEKRIYRVTHENAELFAGPALQAKPLAAWARNEDDERCKALAADNRNVRLSLAFSELFAMRVYEFGPFRLDADKLLLTRAGEPVQLGPKVVETLLALVERPGETLSKAVLIARVWPEGFVEEANLAQNIYVLRKALRAQWESGAIATVPRRGYRFVPTVEIVEAEAAQPTVRRAPVRARRYVLPFAALACAVLVAVSLAIARGHVAQQKTVALSPQGARLYAIGRYYWNQRTATGVEKSLTYFTQVTVSDPHNAKGYVGVADADAIMGDYGYGALPAKTYYSRARVYAGKALAIDPNSAGAYAVLGMLEGMHSPARAEQLFRRAIQLDPSYGPAHQWYGIALLGDGHVREAVRELKVAAQIDPLSVSTTSWLGDAYYLDRNYSGAIEYARQALDLAPNRFSSLVVLGVAYEQQGRYDDAIATFKTYGKACRACGPEADALLARAYALAHDTARARIALSRARNAGAKHVSPIDVALAFAALGDRTQALAWLARVDRTNAIATLDPRLDALRDDVRAHFVTHPA